MTGIFILQVVKKSLQFTYDVVCSRNWKISLCWISLHGDVDRNSKPSDFDFGEHCSNRCWREALCQLRTSATRKPWPQPNQRHPTDFPVSSRYPVSVIIIICSVYSAFVLPLCNRILAMLLHSFWYCFILDISWWFFSFLNICFVSFFCVCVITRRLLWV